MTVSRRHFLAGCAAAPLLADPLKMPIGFQTYSVREALGKDFHGTLKQMAAMGFKTCEMCSPPGYERSGFGSLMKMSGTELKQGIHDAGLRCESCHYGFKEMKENLDERIAFAKQLGLKQMIVSTVGVKNDAPMSDWTKAADELNQIGDKTLKAGLQLGFHNHHFEFRSIDGVLVYDELMKRLDPKLVKMQFQVAVINIGFNAADFLMKYPGRFCSLHLADWSAAEKKTVPIGQGSVDWNKLFGAAKTGGVKNYFVEMNVDLMKASIPYLHGLKA